MFPSGRMRFAEVLLRQRGPDRPARVAEVYRRCRVGEAKGRKRAARVGGSACARGQTIRAVGGGWEFGGGLAAPAARGGTIARHWKSSRASPNSFPQLAHVSDLSTITIHLRPADAG